MTRVSQKLRAEFQAICHAYFPRWRAATTWVLKEGSRARWTDTQGITHSTREQGFCHRDTKTIFVAIGKQDALYRKLVIIHEICHAVTADSHNARFCARIRQAAQRATALGETALAADLLKEADAYASAFVVKPHKGAFSVAARIEELLCNTPGLTLEQVAYALADASAETVPEVRTRYPRLQEVYERIRRREIRVLCMQIKALTAAGVPPPMLTSMVERLRVMEAVTG